MKALVQIGGGITVQAEGEDTKSLFQQIADIQSTFEDTECGLCGCSKLKYVVREVDGNEFYELRCSNEKCRGKLTFGCPQKGVKNIYPKRYKVYHDGKNKGKAMKDEAGNAIALGVKKNGWVRYNPQTGVEE